MKTNKLKNQVKLPFGKKNGELLHISAVPSGLDCECICAACDARLIARKGTENAHHFAHYQAVECEHALETALHLAAKKVLLESAQITLPELFIREQVTGEIEGQSLTKTGSAKVCESHIALIEDVVEEQNLTRIVPDIIAYVDGNPLIIEVGVTHFTDELKKNKIHTLKIASIEIDLSSMDRDMDFETIRTCVVDSIVHKKWLYHTDTERVSTLLRATLEAELKIELDQIYQQEQDRRLHEAQFQQRVLDEEAKTLQAIQISIRQMTNYLQDIKTHPSKFAQALPNSSIWRRASSSMDVSLKDLPSFLNHPVKGEYIFACDRRAWQSGLFSVFIYNKFLKYGNLQSIYVYKMIQWCKEHVPVNQFALALWSHKEHLDVKVLTELYNFDLYTAIREFAKHLESEGVIKSYYQDVYEIVNDTLPPKISLRMYQEALFIGICEADFNALSEDEQEHFQERAGIHEFCGGLAREEAEKLAYYALIKLRTNTTEHSPVQPYSMAWY